MLLNSQGPRMYMKRHSLSHQSKVIVNFLFFVVSRLQQIMSHTGNGVTYDYFTPESMKQPSNFTGKSERARNHRTFFKEHNTCLPYMVNRL